jgi:DNA-binding MarR family transcriptional regulator
VKKPKNLTTKDSLNDLYDRPGFLLRRANQIAVSIFLEESGDLGVTTTQYGAMVVLRARDNLDQISLAKLIGIDRSTAALVINKLEKAGYVARGRDPNDKRRHVLFLTSKGHDVLDRLSEPAERARVREMSAFTEDESVVFLRLLQKFSATFNSQIRTPIIAEGD